ncbi:unnamed protein product [Acanthoscelides obtectus]|uniref:Uncharacterized protein n=1 Tax=Acanthoscelides obtectus TaxID=200917 RepID=A0A9P0Q7P7_ACAOB|nr:unnamed protein product [Acanthoscelides obtectus]CAK1672321.1 hypothetical protein AOBTE_LOCUS28786 [Acanthoscelides obtectus]
MLVRKHSNQFGLMVDIGIERKEVNSDFHTCNTRNNTAIVTPAHNSSNFGKNPNYLGLKLFNELENRIKHINDLGVYKNTLTTYYLKKPFFSMSKYLES